MRDVLSNDQFLRLFTGRLVTNAGDSIYFIAAMWLVWDLTGSTLYTGLAGFIVQVPRGFQFLMGPFVDRWSVREVLVSTQSIQAVVVLAVPVAAWTDNLVVWIVLFLMPILTLLNQFVYPAQNAILPQIVKEEQLPQANSLLSGAYQGADAVFNAVSGVLISILGAVLLYAVDAVSFALAAILFSGLTLPETADGQTVTSSLDSQSSEVSDDRSYITELREGFSYLRGSVLLSASLGAMVANLAFGAMFGVLPAYAANLGGPGSYGLLMGAFGGGIFAGTIGATVFEEYPYGLFTIVAYGSSSISLGFAFAIGRLPATVLLLFVGIVPVGVFNVLFSSLLQTSVAAPVLGRVSATVSSLSRVMVPIGSLAGGLLAGFLSIQVVLFGVALSQAFFSLYFVGRKELRDLPPIFETDESSLRLGNASDANVECEDVSNNSGEKRCSS